MGRCLNRDQVCDPANFYLRHRKGVSLRIEKSKEVSVLWTHQQLELRWFHSPPFTVSELFDRHLQQPRASPPTTTGGSVPRRPALPPPPPPPPVTISHHIAAAA